MIASIVIGGTANAQAPAPAPAVVLTPLCEQVMTAIRGGTKPAVAAQVVDGAEIVQARDTRCLRASGAPPIVINAAMARVRAARAARLAAGQPVESAEADEADPTSPIPAEPVAAPAAAAPPPPVVVVTPVAVVPRLDVEFVSLLVAPFKTTGLGWDGISGGVDPGAVSALASVAGATSPQGAAVGFVASFANKGIDLPDPFGYVEVFAGGQWSTGKLSLVSPQHAPANTCMVTLSSHPTVTGLPDEPGTRVRVVIYDQDMTSNDAIGIAELGVEELHQALAAGEPLPLNVAHQTYNQILWVTVSVRKSDATDLGASGQVFR